MAYYCDGPHPFGLDFDSYAKNYDAESMSYCRGEEYVVEGAFGLVVVEKQHGFEVHHSLSIYNFNEKLGQVGQPYLY